ncbi:MAG: 4Fe-4S single cluster domain-containing protein [Candidatus Bathyarchaeia archaeon]|jgi:anaerobic ribonucleoside-triphosphate reductase activating protein
MKIVVNSIDYRGSTVDGPGIRTVLFVQGCELSCRGCHNPSTWDISNGKTIDTEQLIEELRTKSLNKKLTISGGEPLLQYQAVLELVRNLADFDIALYTGFELEQVPKEIMKYLRHIKVGKYLQEKRSTTIPYVGSSNQKFIELGDANV